MFNKYLRFIKNLKYYFKFLCEDDDGDFIYINKLLLLKLKKVEKFWGNSNTHYIGDDDDKKKLKELINEFEKVIEIQENSENERENKKINFKIYGKLGHLIPKLWT